MGGNAFSNVRRINRIEIVPTLLNFAQDTGIRYKTLVQGLLGSTGKQETSGDIDIALCETQFGRKHLREVAEILRNKNVNVVTKGLKQGVINIAYPIYGSKDLVQVDLMVGDQTFLKFSHYSPGLDVSPYKGVWISTLFGICAKRRHFVRIQEPTDVPRLAEKSVNILKQYGFFFGNEKLDTRAFSSWKYDLENGLYIDSYVYQKDQRIRYQDPGNFETAFFKQYPDYKLPRIPRVGYNIKNPQDIVSLIFGDQYIPEDFSTLEKTWEIVKQVFPDQLEGIIESTVLQLVRSSSANKNDLFELLEIFR